MTNITLKPLPEDFLTILEELVGIGAPTGAEGRRADYIMQRLAEWGADGRVRRDNLHNVWLDLSDGGGGCRLLDAHTDIVFDDDSPPLRKEKDKWFAPGIADNTTACVMLLCLGRELLQSKTPKPLIISFTAGEEGLGDLCGIRATAEEFKPRLKDAVILESGFGKLTCDSVGSKRYRVWIKGPGGHSWGAFGTSSALHEAARLAARLESWMPWEPRKATYNVGILRGGTTVNTIAHEAELVLDFRSTNPELLQEIETGLPVLLKEIEQGAPRIKISREKIGDRPAGSIARDHPLVLETLDAMRSLGAEPKFVVSSTNANATLAAGIPSVCIRLATGSGAHTRDESLNLDSLPAGWTLLNKFVP